MPKKNKGFEIAFDTRHHILRIRVWGFWDTDIAKTYGSTFKEKLREIGTHEQKWSVIMDFTDFPPQSEKVQRIVCQQIAVAEKQRVKKIGYIGKRSVTQLQLNGLSRESDMQRHAFFKSEAEAIEWLLNE